MNGRDWLTVAVLALVLVASIGLDVVRRRMDRRAADRVDSAEHRRLMREIGRLP